LILNFFRGTVLLDGTVPSTKFLQDGTILATKFLLDGTLLATNLYLYLIL
jgi:hypothetical protein